MLHEPSPPPVGSGSGTCLGPCKQTPSGTSPESLHMSVPHTLPTGAGDGEGQEKGRGRGRRRGRGRGRGEKCMLNTFPHTYVA